MMILFNFSHRPYDDYVDRLRKRDDDNGNYIPETKYIAIIHHQHDEDIL